MNKSQIPYNDYSTYIRNLFGCRVQKISINTGNSCPNRDGTKGVGGCTYCNINSISPAYAKSFQSISNQLEQGIAFFSAKYETQKYFAYFQSYTNTYGKLSELQRVYEEALSFPNVIGIVVATRPDCINIDMVNLFEQYAKEKYVSIEIGIESTNENTLKRINRCHTYQDTFDAIELLASRNINTSGHLILGFPWESREDIIMHAKKISLLPLQSVKLHHLQVLKYTQLAKEYQTKKFSLFNADDYLELIIEFLENLNPKIVVQRFTSESPKHLLIAPLWGGVKNYEFTKKVEKVMLQRQTFQGRKYFQ